MRYFTKELWAAFNTDSPDDDERTSREWDENAAEYRTQLEELRKRLSKNAQRFFSSVDLHDGLLLSFSVGDDLEERQDPKVYKRKASALLKVRSWKNSCIYFLRYAGVKRCVVDFPSDSPLFSEGRNGFDDWGYDELTDAGEGCLRHEILFASGAVILIEFLRFSYRRIKPVK
jgi:hypothetical protein